MVQDSSYEQVAHLYDLFDQKPNVEFFWRYASEAGGVLDVGAGTGRIAIPLAERGVRLVCVEPSPAMRREFERKLEAQPELQERITLVGGDARSFALGRTFPMALLSGTFDHFLDDEERMASLQNVARHLAPGGWLVFDVFLGLMGDSPCTPAGTVRVGDREVRRFVGRRSLAGGRQEVRLVFEVHQAGQMVERIEESGRVGVTTYGGVCDLLARTGFEVVSRFRGYDAVPFQEGDDLLVIVAEKT